MYGKAFEQMYTGSMIGAGPVVFAVWGYAIANAGRDHTVELNPTLLAFILGCAEEEVERAIVYLEAPDPRSRSADEEGRRIIHQEAFTYFMVNHEKYREISKQEQLRESSAERARRYRQRHGTSVTVRDGALCDVTDAYSAVSVSVCDDDVLKEEEKPPEGESFDAFWALVVRKVSRKPAERRWKAMTKAERAAAMKAYPAHVAMWKHEKRKPDKIPHPSTWLNQNRWEDEVPGYAVAKTPEDRENLGPWYPEVKFWPHPWHPEDDERGTPAQRARYNEAMMAGDGTGKNRWPRFDQWLEQERETAQGGGV